MPHTLRKEIDQDRTFEIDEERLDQILALGRDKASKIASETLKQTFENVGLSGASR